MNDKCAAVTGRMLELAAESLGVDISELGPLSAEAASPISFRFVCSYLIQIEIRQLVCENSPIADIAAGVNALSANRVASMVRHLPPKNEITLTGGVAKNIGVVTRLEEIFNTPFIRLPVDPQLMGALGAAVFAFERCSAS